MKVALGILTLLLSTTSFCQKMTKPYLVDYVLERWKGLEVSARHSKAIVDSPFINSTKFFTINNKVLEPAKALSAISNLEIDEIIMLALGFYEDANGVQPRILIVTKKRYSNFLKKLHYEHAFNSGFNLKKTLTRDTVYGSGNCALILNGQLIESNKAKTEFFSMSYKDIKYIGFCEGYKHPVYGEDSKNGVIFIWK